MIKNEHLLVLHIQNNFISLLRYLFYILFLVVCNLFNTHNSTIYDNPANRDLCELNNFVNISDLVSDEFFDNTQDDDVIKYIGLIK